MKKQAILKWANELVERYEEVAETAIEETSSDISYSLEELKVECAELREEIRELLELKEEEYLSKMKNIEKEGLLFGVNLSKNIPITFETYKPNRNFNKIVLCKPGRGMGYNIKNMCPIEQDSDK